MNNYFAFKQFTVWQDKTAMKVGTDGVLLGTMTAHPLYSDHDIPNHCRILDIGTGTGLVALIMAQRFPSAVIDAIDIDTDATRQATDNFKASPWSDRLNAICADITSFAPSQRYDIIVCNPPYFNNSLHSPDTQRSVARHTITLDYDSLASAVAQLLTSNGLFSVILPTDSFALFHNCASRHGLSCISHTDILTTPTKPSKRVVAEFVITSDSKPVKNNNLIIELSRHTYSTDFKLLTEEFYLDRK